MQKWLICMALYGALVLLIPPSINAKPAGTSSAKAWPLQGILADYNSELRRADGRVDIEAMVSRLKSLGINTYFWLIWHAATDWDDLKLFLPKAAEAGIDVWVYLVPPSESGPQYSYSEPFRLDYQRWAEEIARLSLLHPNLKAWVIDDFFANRQLFSPSYVKGMQKRAKDISPRLAFLPLMYYGEITRRFVEDYRTAIDGVVVSYPQDKVQIRQASAILNDRSSAMAGEISFPHGTPSRPGDFGMASQEATVLPANRYTLRFEESDDFAGPTAGYHFKQVLVDGEVVWEQDVAGGSPEWQPVAVDVTDRVRSKKTVSIAFRIMDKQGVSVFGIHWRLRNLKASGLRLAAGLSEPEKWKVESRGEFEAGFGEHLKKGEGKFHIPFIVMTSGQEGEFRLRHGDPASPERMAEWIRMSLQSWKDGSCDGVVIYCLDKSPQSRIFDLARELFFAYRKR